MKKFSKILILVLSVVLLVGALIVVSSATDEVPAWTQDEVIAVYKTEADFKADKADGEYTEAMDTFNDFQLALTYAQNNSAAYIALTDNWECGEKVIERAGHLVKSTVTLDLNGYTMSFSVNRKLQDEAYKDFTWNTIQIAGDNITFTIVGNGGTIKVSAGLIQHNKNTSHVILDGGEGGLNIHTIPGYVYDVANSAVLAGANSSHYPGDQMIKVGDGARSDGGIDTGVITLVGKIDIEKHNSKQKVGIETVGNTTINLGTEDKALELSYKDMVNTNHSSNLHALVDAGLYSKSAQQAVYAEKTLGVTVNVINANIDIFSDKLFSMTSGFASIAKEDDIVKVNVKDSYIVADDYAENAGGISNTTCGIFYTGHVNSSVFIDVDDSTIIAKHGQVVFYGADSSAGTLCDRSIITVDNSRLESYSASGNKYPMVRNIVNLVYTNSTLVCDTAASFGAVWRPYSAEDTVITDWPWFVDQGIADGIGVLVKAGCYFSNDLNGRLTNCDYRNGHGIAHTHSNKTCTPTTAMAGTYTKTNYHSCSLTEVDANGCTIVSYHPETNEKLYLVVDKTKPLDIVVSPTGIKTFNSATVGKEYKDASSPNLEGLSWIVSTTTNDVKYPRCGKYNVLASQKFNEADGSFSAESNKYITHSYWANTEGKTYKTDPYFYTYTHGLTEYFSATKPPVIGVTDAQFYTVDLDFMSIKDKCVGLYVTFNLRTLVGGEAKSSMIKVSLGEDGTWASTGRGQEKYKMDFTPGEWMHLTFVLEMPTKVENEVEVLDLASAYDNAKLHLYIDGTLANTFAEPIPRISATEDKCYLDKADSYELTAIQDVRIGFTSATDKTYIESRNGCATAFDNFAYAAHPISSDLEDAASYMTKTMEALGIEQPEDIPFGVATYDDGEGNLTYEKKTAAQLPELLVAAAEGQKPASFKLYTDYADEFDTLALLEANGLAPDQLEPFTFEYIGNGHTIAFKDYDFIVENYDEASDLYTVKKAVAVIFDDCDDTTENAVVYLGYDDTLYTSAMPKLSNPGEIVLAHGKLILDGWGHTAGKKADVTTDTVFTSNTTLYSAIGSTKSTYSGAMYTYTLQDNLCVNFLIPKNDKEGKTDGLTITKVYRAGAEVTPKEVRMYGKSYYRTQSWPSISNFADEIVFKIEHTAPYEGVTYTFTATYKLSALGYCEAVLSDTTGAYDDAKRVVASFLRYGMEYAHVFDTANTNTYEKVKAVYDQYSSLCDTYDEAVLSSNLINTETVNEDIVKYVGSIALDINSTRLRFKLNNFTANSGVKAIEFVTEGYVTSGGVTTWKTISLKSKTNKNNNKTDASGYYTLYMTENLASHYMYNDMTIILTVDTFDEAGNVTGEKTVTGKINIPTYYQALSTENKAKYKNVLLALYEFVEEANAYRYYEEK